MIQQIPYPLKRPDLTLDLGPVFWTQDHVDFFTQLTIPPSRHDNLDRYPAVLELGSAWGRSTLDLLSIFPHSIITCIDTFKGSPEWSEFPKVFTPTQQKTLDSGTLLDQFIFNTWPRQARITILQGPTKDGIKSAACFPVDLIYIDASHQEQDVIDDIETCHNYWPHATFTGDDANFDSVIKAVEKVSRRLGRTVKIWRDRIWHFV
jgi:hypothetical protein